MLLPSPADPRIMPLVQWCKCLNSGQLALFVQWSILHNGCYRPFGRNSAESLELSFGQGSWDRTVTVGLRVVGLQHVDPSLLAATSSPGPGATTAADPTLCPRWRLSWDDPRPHDPRPTQAPRGYGFHPRPCAWCKIPSISHFHTPDPPPVFSPGSPSGFSDPPLLAK